MAHGQVGAVTNRSLESIAGAVAGGDEVKVGVAGTHPVVPDVPLRYRRGWDFAWVPGGHGWPGPVVAGRPADGQFQQARGAAPGAPVRALGVDQRFLEFPAGSDLAAVRLVWNGRLALVVDDGASFLPDWQTRGLDVGQHLNAALDAGADPPVVWLPPPGRVGYVPHPRRP